MRRLLVIALLVACGDDDSGTGMYVAVDDIAAAYKDAQCTYYVRCGLFPDHDACVGANIGVGFELDPNMIAAIHAGTITYNGNAIAACFESIAARECDRTSRSHRTIPESCRTYKRGTLAADTPCFLDQECISQQCTGNQVEDACVAGTCVGDTPPDTDLLPIGAACAHFSACVAGAYCATDTGVCTKLIAEGDLCADSNECTYGFACIGATGARTCGALPAEDQPCPDGVCRDEGLYCSTSTGTCRRVGLPLSVCTSSEQCSPYYPCDFGGGLCTQGPTLGESCSSATPCFSVGTYCSPSTFTCTKLEPDGAPCSSGVQCESADCDFATGTCAGRLVCL